MNATYDLYPMDALTLKKGTTIGTDELEKITGSRRTDRLWGLRILRLRSQIERIRKDAGLPRLTIRCVKDTLRVCSDSEATVYCLRRAKLRLNGFARDGRHLIAVDNSQLTPQQLRVHATGLVKHAMLLSAIRRAQLAKVPELVGAPERTTPKAVLGPGPVEDANPSKE